MNKTQLDKTLGTIKNYVDDGLSKKSDSGHTHKYAGSSSAGGAANSVKTNLTIKLNSGTTEGANLFTFNGSTAKTLNITPSSIGTYSTTEIDTKLGTGEDALQGQIDDIRSSLSGVSSSLSTLQTDFTNHTHDYASNRLATKLVPSGTSIAANTDLNTTNLIKVGSYYCSSDSTVQTLKNCPTGSAFMMEVYSPLSPTIDNEATGQWVYRVRKLMTYTGIEYIQMVNSDSTAGKFTYGSWVKLTPSDATTSASGLMTAAMVTKLNGIASGANKYTHPSYTAKSSGFYKVTVDASGHVSGTAAVVKSDITALGIPAQDTTYSAATTSTAGLMSASDKSKLDGIASGANNYSHPTGAGNNHIPSGGSANQYLKYSSSGVATWQSLPSASTSAAGIVQLSSSTSGTSESKAATEKAVKAAYDKANHGHPYLSTSGGTLSGAVTVNLTSGSALTIAKTSSNHRTMVFASTNNGEHIFGGNNDGSTTVTDFIRVGVNKLTYETGGTVYNIYHAGNKPSASTIGAAPTSHASTATTYGAASASNYGHAMASSTAPKANTGSSGSVGSETAKFARGDHAHPLQTTVSGNAGTATKLQISRKIGNASFDGSADITLAQMGVADIQVVTQAQYEALVSAGTVNDNTYYLISNEIIK